MNIFLFDLDGTIVDSQDGIFSCLRYTLESLGAAEAAKLDLTWCVGPPLDVVFQQMNEQGHQLDVKKAVQVFREKYRKDGLLLNRLYPGIRELIVDLKRRGASVYLATSKLESFARIILDQHQLTDYFDGIYGSDPEGLLNSKGRLIAHLLVSESLQSEGVYMIGDREHDVFGARENKVKAIGVLWGYGTEAELRNAGSDHLIRTPNDLLTLPHFHSVQRGCD